MALSSSGTKECANKLDNTWYYQDKNESILDEAEEGLLIKCHNVTAASTPATASTITDTASTQSGYDVVDF